ncbi:hypothetical protein F4819DRAFT_483964 [Hypoxylon fuscum]|nr:hypothetical protein F4819DRAFT_483964 [Hypoxylon fuscum]
MHPSKLFTYLVTLGAAGHTIASAIQPQPAARSPEDNHELLAARQITDMDKYYGQWIIQMCLRAKQGMTDPKQAMDTIEAEWGGPLWAQPQRDRYEREFGNRFPYGREFNRAIQILKHEGVMSDADVDDLAREFGWA